MFIAVVLVCLSPVDIGTCQLVINSKRLYSQQSECIAEASQVTQYFVSRGAAAIPYCLQEEFGEAL